MKWLCLEVKKFNYLDKVDQVGSHLNKKKRKYFKFLHNKINKLIILINKLQGLLYKIKKIKSRKFPKNFFKIKKFIIKNFLFNVWYVKLLKYMVFYSYANNAQRQRRIHPQHYVKDVFFHKKIKHKKILY